MAIHNLPGQLKYSLLGIAHLVIISGLLAPGAVCAVSARVDEVPAAQSRQAVPTEHQASMCEWIGALDDTGQALALYYFNRQAVVRVFDESRSLPFRYPTRPTLSVRVGDTDYQLLFDTGTYSCILRFPASGHLPDGIQLTDSVERIARLESKNASTSQVNLEYGTARYMRIGGLRFRDVAFRLYTAKSIETDVESQPADTVDFDGAVSPIILRDWVIEVDNDALLINLHEETDFMPPAGCLVLPVLTLPRGLFIPLTIENQVYWFHLDTGFSGSLGLLQSTADEHRIEFKDKDTRRFNGWQGSSDYLATEIRGLSISPYRSLAWAVDSPYCFDRMEALLYPDIYDELSDYDIGGIVGSGLLSHFNYFLDLRLSRLYLIPRE